MISEFIQHFCNCKIQNPTLFIPGYKYFGAAKDLPGVRELFEEEPAKANRKNRAGSYGILKYNNVIFPVLQDLERAFLKTC